MTGANPRGMKHGARLVVAVAVAAAAAAGAGYWFGRQAPHEAAGAQSTSGGAAPAAAGAPAAKERKPLYYRNPMGLPDTSPAPKKDPMGMDYLPVFADGDEDRAANANQIKISTDKVQKLGVRSEAVRRAVLEKTVRAAGRIEADERRVVAIAPKFEGYVERLHVNVTGQPVGRGQPLFEVYSPELVSAQREYAIAAKGVEALKGAEGTAQADMRELAEAGLLRLKNWDISDEQIKSLAKSGEARRTLTFRSPVAGIVTEKKALQGMRFMPGEMLYQIADLSSVWVIADVFEQDIGEVRVGAPARVRINAYPDKVFEGKVSYVYPTLKQETRTVPVRLELANPGLLLKPAMFAEVELPVAATAAVLVLPTAAVIDSGRRRVVLVEKGEGRFEPREVKLGARSEHEVEVIDGVAEGERIVVAANFLIDAESNLKAAIGGFGPAEPIGGKPASSGHQAEGKVDSVDAKAGTVSITHGPVASLNWPAMTMDFKPANPALAASLKPGATITFEFVERAPGEWVITAVKPATAGAGGTASATKASKHAGH